MKKILSLLLLIGIAQHSYSQVYLGLSSGVSISKIKNDNRYSDLIAHTRFNVEIPIIYKLNKNIAFQSGLSYINMGGTYKIHLMQVNDGLYDSKFFFRLNYLSLPLTFNFSLPLNKYSLYGRAGIYMSYLLSADMKSAESGEKYKKDLKDDQFKIHRFDAGFVFGTGVTRTLGNGFIFFDVRYMIGLCDLNKGLGSNIYVPMKNAFNRSLLLNVGYMFRLGKAE